MTEPSTPPHGTSNDGAPAEDRREDILEPSSGDAGRPADTIRDQQGNHEGGMVPASYTGDGKSRDSEDAGPPEAATDRADEWDAEG
ncbi:hypothetical protein [Arthrobacter sp. H41]|uniref:hypothetical protein n=1 Tax=Arthrobacter sp. H41 TaxID=1312978 RepID=UPI00047DABFF|nr:hypothetical protein [Arthrobacter sp. H41]